MQQTTPRTLLGQLQDHFFHSHLRHHFCVSHGYMRQQLATTPHNEDVVLNGKVSSLIQTNYVLTHQLLSKLLRTVQIIIA